MLNIMYFIVLSVIKYDVSCKDNCFFVCLSIYKFKMFVFCFGSWFISVYFCGRNSRGCKSLGLDCHINK